MNEESLHSHEDRPIVRIGDTVHRPAHWWTPAVHELLNYLESVHFPYSPRVLGFDDQGREILTFIEGESGADSWKKVVTDEGLRKLARLLRAYHEAVAGFHPSGDLEWAYAKGAPGVGEIICHGDFGPWNIVWQGSDPVGIVDWDMALPAQPRFDILYALEYAVPFRDDKTTLEWHHFPQLPDRKHRIGVFAEAYGISDVGTIAADVAAMQRTVGGYEKHLAERGLQPQVDWVAGGDLEQVEKRAQWTETNKSLFE